MPADSDTAAPGRVSPCTMLPGFTGTQEQALALFDTLAPEEQRIFLRQIYYAELREGGREYNDVAGPRFGSYLRGRQMIAALLPDKDAQGSDLHRAGDILMYGGALTPTTI